MKRKDATQIQVTARSRELDFRAINYYVNTERFLIALEESTDDEYDEIMQFITDGKPSSLRIKCRKIASRSLDDKSVAQLRIIASGLHIPNYNKYHKPMLLLKIKESRREDGKSSRK